MMIQELFLRRFQKARLAAQLRRRQTSAQKEVVGSLVDLKRRKQGLHVRLEVHISWKGRTRRRRCTTRRPRASSLSIPWPLAGVCGLYEGEESAEGEGGGFRGR